MSARILVVEDNPESLALMTYLLRYAGYTPDAAEDGERGLAAARKNPPDLVVMDVQMPTLDGYQAAAAMKSDPGLRHTPIVAVTAYAMVGDRERIMRAGFDGYITKPIDVETFVGRIEAFLDPALRPAGPPARVEPAAAPAVPQASPKRWRATILVNDNSPENIVFMRSVFEAFGYRVVSTGSAEDAIAVARDSPPDIIVTDLSMEGGGGEMLLREAKADPGIRHVPIVVVSSTHRPDPSHLRALGAATFIPRPIEPSELLRLVEACLPDGG